MHPLPDGRQRFVDGPIDLVIAAHGPDNIKAYDAGIAAAGGILDDLCTELTLLRSDLRGVDATGPVARTMQQAVWPMPGFITPMAAVAGAVAEHVLAAMVAAAPLDRAYVNNGGDIALHLAPGQTLRVGIAQPRCGLNGMVQIRACDPVRGIATSGWPGRSHSLGIADAVTVLASTAGRADAAATVIANAVDLPSHEAITRVPACELAPDSDLGPRLVTRHVGRLSHDEIEEALAAGSNAASALLRAGLIAGVALTLQEHTHVVGELLSFVSADGVAYSQSKL